MRLPAAINRNRLAVFLAPPGRAGARDAVFNTPLADWSVAFQEWVEVQDMLPSRGERIAEGISVAARPCRIRMLWRADVSAAMRVRFDDEGGRLLQIVTQPAELGFREGLELVAEEVSTMGAVP